MRRHPAFACLICLLLPLAAHAATDKVPAYESLRLTSTVMREARRINVYLPPGYDTCKDNRYPVLYMPDGGAAEDFPHVAASVDRLISEGAIAPLLLVGVENTVRRRDMTGPTQSADDLKVTSEPGGAPRFRRFFASELAPVIRARYRTTKSAGIIGESLAGLFIVETLQLQPDLFDTYIALDPSLWWNNESITREAPQRWATWRVAAARLLLTTGGEASNAVQVDRFVEALKQHAPAALQWTYLPRPDLQHDTIYRGMKETLLRAAYAPSASADGCTLRHRSVAPASHSDRRASSKPL